MLTQAMKDLKFVEAAIARVGIPYMQYAVGTQYIAPISKEPRFDPTTGQPVIGGGYGSFNVQPMPSCCGMYLAFGFTKSEVLETKTFQEWLARTMENYSGFRPYTLFLPRTDWKTKGAYTTTTYRAVASMPGMTVVGQTKNNNTNRIIDTLHWVPPSVNEWVMGKSTQPWVEFRDERGILA